jgi:lysozyme
MSLGDVIRADLIRDEDLVLHAYQDSLGYWTIGVGRLIDKAKGGGITEAEAMILLNNDITRVCTALYAEIPWLDKKPANIKRALINMAFQLDVSGLLKFTKMLRHIEAGRYANAADEALKSKWAKQTPARAKRIAMLLLERE